MKVRQKCTERMYADFFTKPLHGEGFIMLRNIIMGADEVPDQGEAMDVAEPRQLQGHRVGTKYKGHKRVRTIVYR